jgi:hypothetical protein
MNKEGFAYYRMLELLGTQDELNVIIVMADKAGDEVMKAHYIEERRAVNAEIHRIGNCTRRRKR